jgi:hypothetical protein
MPEKPEKQVTIQVKPGSPLEKLLEDTQRKNQKGKKKPYTTLDAVARPGCHIGIARPMNPP